MTTDKLYLNDSLLLDFQATLLEVSEYEGKPALILDATVFYGEAGGQLGDRGELWLDDWRVAVVDVQIDDKGRYHHVVENADNAPIGKMVKGRVDVDFRRDMMSQHTGQHMLSCAFHRVAGLETVSSRLGSRDSTIDLDQFPIKPEVLQEVEDMVNGLVLENRAVNPLYPNAEELAALPLRRQPKVYDRIRILEIADFDFTPCGGTHCSSTGQVGPVRITSTEKYKGQTRVHFLCGARALNHLVQMDNLVRDLSNLTGSNPIDLPGYITKYQEEYKERGRQLGKLRADLMRHIAEEVLAANPPAESGHTVIAVGREHEDAAAVRSLASTLARRADVLAFVAGRADGDWHLVIERGENVDYNAGSWFKTHGKALGARGGGRPNRAEGRVPGTVSWEDLPKP